MQYFLIFLIIPFIYLNYKILISDIKYKIIPNQYLIYLLSLIPLYYIYTYFNFPDIHYWFFVIQIFFTFFVSFILYYFGIWAAWDAKYLLVLSLFIPYIWVIPLIWNIAIVTIVYLIWYFLWFYFWKTLMNKNYRNGLFKMIQQDLKWKWKIYKENKNSDKNNFLNKNLFIIIRWLVAFLIIFVSIRLSRIYILKDILETWNSFVILKEFIEKYDIYIIAIFILASIAILYGTLLLINKWKTLLADRFKLNLTVISNICIIILFFALIGFISYELKNNYSEIIHLLWRVSTLYLWIYIILKILLYSYKLAFGISETANIAIRLLKEGDIVDKDFLMGMFWDQKCLLISQQDRKKNIDNKILLYPDPKTYFSNIQNPIDWETLATIKKAFFVTNKHHKYKKTPWYQKINQIRVLKTFAFVPYIVGWFFITYLVEDQILHFIIDTSIRAMQSFY